MIGIDGQIASCHGPRMLSSLGQLGPLSNWLIRRKLTFECQCESSDKCCRVKCQWSLIFFKNR